MRFHRIEPPRTSADFDWLNEHWKSFGWQLVPKADERAITDAWSTKCERGSKVVLPSPFCTWDISALWGLEDRADEIESEVTLKILIAFRRCVHPGERLLVIDWMHSWYYFDPFGGITEATRDEWAYPILPDEFEPHYFLARDFRFGVSADTGRRLTIFGADLLDAVALDPPFQFLRLCKCIRKADRQRWRKFQIGRNASNGR
jgi:hypothetical protein